MEPSTDPSGVRGVPASRGTVTRTGMRAIPDGTTITLDGSQGLVRILR